MRRFETWSSRACAAAVTILMFGGLAGCAALGKCGLRGCPGDADITAEVRALYTQYPALEATNSIDIQTVDRIVYLRGVVDTPFQRRFAEEVALKAKGVSRVANLLGLSNSR
jgi:osmotically-inducible protein OsmY